MIKANELRIGNWVKSNLNPVPLYLKVTGILNSRWQIEANHGEYDYSDLEPIPLTPEILEKVEFETPEDYQKTVLYKDGIMIDLHMGKYKLRDNTRITLKYLHQLQNLYFSLTQTELEIKF